MEFSETNSRKKWPMSREFQGKIRVKFGRKTIDKKGQFRGNFLGKFRYKAIGFALISRTFLMKQDGSFAHFWGGGK